MLSILLQGAQQEDGRDRRHEEDPARVGGGGRPLHRHQGDFAAQGAAAPQHRLPSGTCIFNNCGAKVRSNF